MSILGASFRSSEKRVHCTRSEYGTRCALCCYDAVIQDEMGENTFGGLMTIVLDHVQALVDQLSLTDKVRLAAHLNALLAEE